MKSNVNIFSKKGSGQGFNYQGGYVGLLLIVIAISIIGIMFVYINDKQNLNRMENGIKNSDNPINKAQNIKSTLEMKDQKLMQEMSN